MPPKKKGLGARDNVDDIFRKDRAEIFVDNDPRAGYEDDLEQRVVYRRIESHVEEMKVDEEWTKMRVRIFSFVVISFLGGAFLVILSNMRIQLEVFESQPQLWWLEIIGYIMMAPCFGGIKYFCCPSREQTELRNTILARRRVRHRLYPEQFKEVEVFTDVHDQYAQRQKDAKSPVSSPTSREKAYQA